MKKFIAILILILPCLQSCVENTQTGEMQPGWLFWVFLGLLLGGVFIGAIVNFLKKKRPEDAPSKAQEEIEAYQETLEKKLKDKKEEKDNTNNDDH